MLRHERTPPAERLLVLSRQGVEQRGEVQGEGLRRIERGAAGQLGDAPQPVGEGVAVDGQLGGDFSPLPLATNNCFPSLATAHGYQPTGTNPTTREIYAKKLVGENVASQVQNNGSFNCNAAKVLVQQASWDLRPKLLDALKSRLRSMPARKA